MKQPKTTQWSENISGVNTDFVVTTFAESLFVVITQTKRIATMVSACIDDADAGNKIYSSKIIFGDRSKQYNAIYGRSLIELVNKQGVQSLVLGLSVAEGSDTFNQIMGSLKERF